MFSDSRQANHKAKEKFITYYKTKNGHKQMLSFLQTFQNDQIFLHHPSERSHFGIKSCSY